MTDRDAGLVRVDADGVPLEGNLLLPDDARGVVVFAHGSGSSRFSSRNRYVAEVLRGGAHGTLLLDLLTREEEAVDTRTAHLRFDIGMLADRLVATVKWLRKTGHARGVTHEAGGTSPVGYDLCWTSRASS